MENPIWEPLKEKRNNLINNMRIFYLIPVLSITITTLTCKGRDVDGSNKNLSDSNRYRIMFYNTENFFDIFDDSLTADEDFTPAGIMHWTHNRYNTKLKNIYKAIVATGGWQPPDVIGLCEVENKFVVSDLIKNTPLSKFPYHIIHNNSSDRRGIDVALLYNHETVRYLSSTYFKIRKPGLFTREILYFKALLDKDTCHFLVNHWPSRSAGQSETEIERMAAAKKLRTIADSLLKRNESAKILIMGDFNDEPADKSLVEGLIAFTDLTTVHPSGLYNISVAPSKGRIRGTLKYQGKWNLFDQVIVSGNFLLDKKGLSIHPIDFHIYDAIFLLTEDNQYTGYKPYRTYNGIRYQGGFSDHLPVYVDLKSSDEGRGTRDK
jgi:predicted extracellular nuclease